jgi:hypothetical protein
MKRIAKLIAGLQLWIKRTFDKSFASLIKAAPVAINIVEEIKRFLDSPIDDLILAIVKVPGSEALRDKLQDEWLPKVAVRLSIVYGLSMESATPEEMLRNVQAKLLELRFNNVPMGHEWDKIATEILAMLADGKVTMNELKIATQLVHYELFLKPKP